MSSLWGTEQQGMARALGPGSQANMLPPRHPWVRLEWAAPARDKLHRGAPSDAPARAAAASSLACGRRRRRHRRSLRHPHSPVPDTYRWRQERNVPPWFRRQVTSCFTQLTTCFTRITRCFTQSTRCCAQLTRCFAQLTRCLA